jgi:Ca2+-binding EF-hand superfamily protein
MSNPEHSLGKDDLAVLRQIVKELQSESAYSPTAKQLNPEQLKWFDVNGDGQVDYDDVVALCQQIISHSPEDLEHSLQDEEKLNKLREKIRAKSSG